MRCYLMRRGGIVSVEFLEAGPDGSLIEQGRAIFEARTAERFDGFEVWDGARPVFRYPPKTGISNPEDAGNGSQAPQ